MSRKSVTQRLVTWLFAAKKKWVRSRQTDRPQTDPWLYEGQHSVGVWTLKMFLKYFWFWPSLLKQNKLAQFILWWLENKPPKSSAEINFWQHGLNKIIILVGIRWECVLSFSIVKWVVGEKYGAMNAVGFSFPWQLGLNKHVRSEFYKYSTSLLPYGQSAIKWRSNGYLYFDNQIDGFALFLFCMMHTLRESRRF